MQNNKIEFPPEFESERPRLEAFQCCQLESLRKVAKVCDDHGLRYYLASGTALGAARHGGFIPWDDDIDIVLPRPDFDRLEKLIFDGDVSLRAYEWTRTPNFFLPAMKVASADVASLDHSPYAIDVFPLDILPESKMKRRFQETLRIILLQALQTGSGYYSKRLSSLRLMFAHLIRKMLPYDPRIVHGWIRKMMERYGEWSDDVMVGGRFSQYGEREFMPFAIFGTQGGSEVVFCGEKFKAPRQLEKYLSNFYGDWQQLPPVEKRIPKHTEDGPWFWYKPKIAFLIQDMVGQGVQYATAIIARAFVKKGWQVDLLVSPVHDDKVAAGGKAFELPPEVNWVRMPNRHGSRNGWFVRQYLKHGGADIVLAESGIYSWCVLWASFGIPKSKLPCLAQVDHGNTDLLTGFRLVKYKVRNWYRYRKFSALMFVNGQSAENFKKMYGFLKSLRVGVVNNACVDDVFFEKVKLSPAHQWLIHKTCPTFVTAGSYTPGKCHLMVMEAFRIASKQRKVRLLVYGRGFLEPKYNEFIKDHHLEDVISVAGFTDQLPAEISAADCLISSSDEESFGITIGEALACHKPVISTDAPMGPREILADGKYGRLVPINDPEAMAQAVVDCADGKIPVPPDESWQRYTIDKIAQRYFDILGVS